MDVTLYYNAKCSKARTALTLLRERGIQPHVVDYLKTPLTRDELASLVEKLGVGPRDLLRTNEPAYREQGLARPDVTDDQILDALATTPRLLQRPIAVAGSRAVVARPPERVFDVLP
jgi:arsenate reductase